MKKYALKTILFFFPFLIIFSLSEIWLRETNNTNTKSKHFEKNKDNIELLFLGPSHFVYGLNPELLDLPTANLAEEGSAFNIDFLMVKRLLPELPKLKFLILDLSLGNLERWNQEDWFKNHLYYLFYGVKNFPPSWKDHFLLTSKYSHYRKIIFRKIKVDKDRYNKYGFMTTRFNHEKHFNDLLLGNKKGKEVFKQQVNNITMLNESNYLRNIEFLGEIIEKCRVRNIKVILLSTPKFHLINKSFEKIHYDRRNKILDQFIDNNQVQFWNCENTYQTDTSLFYDPIHLNVDGANKFTKEINRKILDLESEMIITDNFEE
ncbi:hypothetical protein GCM10028791_44010 [Echinicola sediminis]